jgi:hypothetical protein
MYTIEKTTIYSYYYILIDSIKVKGKGLLQELSTFGGKNDRKAMPIVGRCLLMDLKYVK